MLRKKGLAAAQKKVGRSANSMYVPHILCMRSQSMSQVARAALEGLVCVATRGSEAAVVEVFLARTTAVVARTDH